MEEYLNFKADGAAATSAAQFNPAVIPEPVAIAGPIVIDGNLSSTKNPQVTLTLTWEGGSGNGVSRMRFSDDGAHWTAGGPAAATREYALPLPNGYHTVRVQFRDTTGNVSASYNDYIRLLIK